MAVKFQTNVPLTLLFPYGDFMPVQGQYGEQYLYTVEIDGQRDKLYATPKLHQELQAAGVGPGETLTITKVEGEGNRKGWQVQPESGKGKPGEENPPPATTSSPSASNGRQQPPDFATLDQLMAHCLRAAQNAWEGISETVEVTSDDIRRTAISLFIECTRRGIRPHPTKETEAAADDEDLPF